MKNFEAHLSPRWTVTMSRIYVDEICELVVREKGKV